MTGRKSVTNLWGGNSQRQAIKQVQVSSRPRNFVDNKTRGLRWMLVVHGEMRWRRRTERDSVEQLYLVHAVLLIQLYGKLSCKKCLTKIQFFYIR